MGRWEGRSKEGGSEGWRKVARVGWRKGGGN